MTINKQCRNSQPLPTDSHNLLKLFILLPSTDSVVNLLERTEKCVILNTFYHSSYGSLGWYSIFFGGHRSFEGSVIMVIFQPRHL
jgi:hypothetical protein